MAKILQGIFNKDIKNICKETAPVPSPNDKANFSGQDFFRTRENLSRKTNPIAKKLKIAKMVFKVAII